MLTATNKKAMKVLGAKIKASLDGRTQRWLAEKIPMAEDYLSNKLKGKFRFSDEELCRINEILSTDFENI